MVEIPTEFKGSSYGRGAVVWADDLFKENNNEGEKEARPWVIISNRNHPFDDEWIAMSVTTKSRKQAVPITNDAWIQGSLDKMSFVSPWSVVTIQRKHVWSYIGTLRKEYVDRLIEEMNEMVCSNLET